MGSNSIVSTFFPIMELGIKLSSFLVIVAYALNFVRLNAEVDISLLVAFDLSIGRLLSIRHQSQLDLLDLHYVPFGDIKACACVCISNRHHQDLFREELHNPQMFLLHRHQQGLSRQKFPPDHHLAVLAEALVRLL